MPTEIELALGELDNADTCCTATDLELRLGAIIRGLTRRTCQTCKHQMGERCGRWESQEVYFGPSTPAFCAEILTCGAWEQKHG